MAKGQVHLRETKKPKQAKRMPSPVTGVSWTSVAKTAPASEPVTKK
jgi:hypothetical protein